MRQRNGSLKPTQKVAAGGIAGALSIILVWMIEEFARIKIPAEVASALTVVIGVLTSYLTPAGEGE
jgi:putative flippase GtrA